jgi:hypothetical protein
VRRAVGISLVIAIALVFLNDVGRWVNAQAQLNANTGQLAQWASTNVGTEDSDSAERIVTREGVKLGVRVSQYDQDQYTVRVWGSADVRGTWVIGPLVAVAEGASIDRALSVPFVVRTYQQARLQ